MFTVIVNPCLSITFTCMFIFGHFHPGVTKSDVYLSTKTHRDKSNPCKREVFIGSITNICTSFNELTVLMLWILILPSKKMWMLFLVPLNVWRCIVLKVHPEIRGFTECQLASREARRYLRKLQEKKSNENKVIFCKMRNKYERMCGTVKSNYLFIKRNKTKVISIWFNHSSERVTEYIRSKGNKEYHQEIVLVSTFYKTIKCINELHAEVDCHYYEDCMLDEVDQCILGSLITDSETIRL